MQWNSSNPDTSGTREKVSILVRCPCTTGVELHATTVLGGGGCPCWRGVLICPTSFWRLLSSRYLPSHDCTRNSWDTHKAYKNKFCSHNKIPSPPTNFTAHTQASFDNPGNTNYVIPIEKWAAEYIHALKHCKQLPAMSRKQFSLTPTPTVGGLFHSLSSPLPP